MKILIVGAGFAGSTCARVLADKGYNIKVIDIRNHIGGNAYDYFDSNGVLVHKYGPHIFHTNSEKVFKFLSRFTEWRFYEHRVLSEVNGKLYPIPINRTTLSMVTGQDMSELEAEKYLESKRIRFDYPKNSEEVVLNSVGKSLCEMFFSGYTRKQWSLELKDLSAGVASRIPTRTNDDDRYFTDCYQFMPNDGYTQLFIRMLEHPLIDVSLGIDFFDIKQELNFNHIIYTGPIDRYFNYCHGKLPYRSLKFSNKHIENCSSWQQAGTINYPNCHDYTRITEMKKITGQVCSGTSLVIEYPCDEGDPFYPIPRKENQELYKKYLEMSENEENVSFTGRLAEYKYYNMDQVVASALKLSHDLIKKFKNY